MNRTSKIIGGIALLAFGIGWALDLSGVLQLNLCFDGWWTLFIIIPCFVSLFNGKSKIGSLIGLGLGVLLLLSTRGIILWMDFWKYFLCLLAVVWGCALVFGRSKMCNRGSAKAGRLESVDQEGRQIQHIDVSFGKQTYAFGGQRFEGAKVHTSFGFTAIDLRNSDLLDGAVVEIDCSFGGMEISVGEGVSVHTAVETSFAGIENHCNTGAMAGLKNLYLKGRCSFGGIEIR